MNDEQKAAQDRVLNALAALSQDVQENGSDQYAVDAPETDMLGRPLEQTHETPKGQEYYGSGAEQTHESPAGSTDMVGRPIEQTHESPTSIVNPEPHPADGPFPEDDNMPTRQGAQEADGLGFTDNKVNAEIEVDNYLTLKGMGVDVSDFAFAYYQGDPSLLDVSMGHGIATHLTPADPGAEFSDPQLQQNNPAFDF